MTEANLIDNVEQAVRFVEDRLAEGADYIKIIADVPGKHKRAQTLHLSIF